jgi:ketosteroid isomerase-like protein
MFADMQQAEAFGSEWLRGWRERDLDAIMTHYADDAEQNSPLVAAVLGDTSGRVVGKTNIRAYFQKVMDTYPADPEVQLVGVLRGVHSLVVLFRTRGRDGAEFMELDSEGKVRRGFAHGRY